MEEPTSSVPPQPFPNGSQHVQTTFPGFHPHDHSSLASQLDPSLQNLNPEDTYAPEFTSLDSHANGPLLHDGNPFGRASDQPRFQEVRSHMGPPSQRQPSHAFQQAGQFGVLLPRTVMVDHAPLQHNAFDRLQQEDAMTQVPEPNGEKKEGHFANMKNVPNPPNLAEWRERLFNVNDTVTMTEDEFQTYFPHVDNIYSHRSTQKYKLKPFVSHYWDCRLKGRPPGTPKSEDPNKRKRKRSARERDLCDVKIKITEFSPGARTFIPQKFGNEPIANADVPDVFQPGQPYGSNVRQQEPQPFGMNAPDGRLDSIPGGLGEKYYTIQRVNGNGGNGKGDGVAGPHKHTLEESDRVKKNSIQRQSLKEEKVKKKSQAEDADTVQSAKKTYHKKATGAALVTAKRHAKEHNLKLYGSCFCPFVQRVWIALEAKGIGYQYIEVDPYKKPESLMEINPRGLVPALRHDDWATHESTVIMEYLEDLNVGEPMLPLEDPKARAHCRLWTDHINKNIVPAFYHYLQEQNIAKQVEHASKLKSEIAKLVDAADSAGPFFLGNKLSFVDIQLAPWLLRMKKVLKPYRGWPDPEEGSRWEKWVDAVENDVDVKATTSTDDLYLDSYERYAENRPNTSQVAEAVNAGRGLP